MGQLKLKFFGVVMGDKKIYVVAKIFDQQGCLAYLCKTPNEARCLPGTLEALRADGVQIVILDSPEIYSEYAPYTYEHAPQMKADGVSDYRQLAAFGDTVLAATYSEKNGFMFCTWKQNADGDSVFWGDYSPNYE